MTNTLMQIKYSGEVWTKAKLIALTKHRRSRTWAWDRLNKVKDGRLTMRDVLREAHIIAQETVKRKYTEPVIEITTPEQRATLEDFCQIHRGELSANILVKKDE